MYDISLRQEAIELYKKGLIAREVGEKLNLNPATITYWVRQAGVVRHRGPQSKIKKEDFFDVINTEEKAYFLGWLMADGCISTYGGQYSIKLHISIDDKDIVNSFLAYIDSTNKTKDKGESYYVSLTSVHMCKSLMTLGVVENKSAKETIPEIKDFLLPHFVRGYFDGDGITCIKKAHRSGFIGSKEILEGIQHLLNENITIFSCQGSQYFLGGIAFSKKLYDYMYSNATIWLPRKRERMNIICGNTEVINSCNKLLAP